ncbi:MAG: hypothetical protein VX876_03545 [Planctomycetota bacterium]|nr:hypothetical protein [Planctomycetota bacterium]
MKGIWLIIFVISVALFRAQTDPKAQATIDWVMRHSEFELYNIKNNPWELTNLADNPDYIKKLKEMNTQLKVDMEKLKVGSP